MRFRLRLVEDAGGPTERIQGRVDRRVVYGGALLESRSEGYGTRWGFDDRGERTRWGPDAWGDRAWGDRKRGSSRGRPGRLLTLAEQL